MLRYCIVSVSAGLLFVVMDGLINANPLAQKLMAVFRPVARTSVNIGAGIAIDLFYGFAMAGLFILLYPALPGASGWLKGVSFALIAWFFRVLMSAASQALMYPLPAAAIAYILATGLGEMLLLGLLFGLALRPGR